MRAVDRWNGSSLISQKEELWNGSALVQQAWDTGTDPVVEPDSTAFVYPSDANIINIKLSPYNAVGDGSADDTAKIQQALNDHAWEDADTTHSPLDNLAPRIIYFPAGTYRITNSLIAPGCALALVGAGETLTKIKLDNNATGFGSSGSPKYVLKTGNAGDGSADQANSGFSNFVRRMTIEVGTGNPGAVALRFDGANVAAVQKVTLKGNSGLRGLALETTAGPLMIQDLTVDGFSQGIYTDSSKVNNMCLSGITLKNQTTVGIRNTAKNLQIENLTTINVPKVLEHVNDGAWTLMTNSTLGGQGSGTAITLNAIGMTFLRNIDASGWTNLVTQGGTVRFTGKTRIEEWCPAPSRSGTTTTAYTESSTQRSLNLPFKKGLSAPVFPVAQWVNVKDFGAVGNGTTNDRAAFQAAIDSGAEMIYVPYDRYLIGGTVIIRNNVKVINFCFSQIMRQASGDKFQIAAGTSPTVWLEDVESSLTIEQNSSRTVICRNMPAQTSGSGGGGNPTFTTGTSATGDFFVENTGPRATMNITQPISVFTRQTNRETTPATYSNGAVARVFSDNIEQKSSATTAAVGVFTINSGSVVEIVGGAFDNLDNTTAWPTGSAAAYRSTDASVSMVLAASMRGNGKVYRWLTDKDGSTVIGEVFDTDLVKETTTANDQRVFMPLYASPGIEPGSSSADINLVSRVQGVLTSASGTTISATLGAAPTAGNLLIVVGYTPATADQSGVTVSSPAGFTKAVQSSTATTGGTAIFYRIATGGEGTSYSVAFNPSTSASMRMAVIELNPGSGQAWHASPLVTSGSATGSSATTVTTAATEATAQATYALAAVGVNGIVTYNHAWTGGFTWDGVTDDRLSIAAKKSTVSETLSTTETWNTARTVRSALASFRLA